MPGQERVHLKKVVTGNVQRIVKEAPASVDGGGKSSSSGGGKGKGGGDKDGRKIAIFKICRTDLHDFLV